MDKKTLSNMADEVVKEENSFIMKTETGELSQDITEIKRMEGEKRLLEWQ
ncbi:hypothetical protein [Lutispora sp.]|nr:hypothetical protein [Lutispora sp.]MEA4963384.1 hypothetical protein [Lutispora sp.]